MADVLPSIVREYHALQSVYTEKNKELGALRTKLNELEGKMTELAQSLNGGASVAVTYADTTYTMKKTRTASSITLGFLKTWAGSNWPPTESAEDWVAKMWQGRPSHEAWAVSRAGKATVKKPARD